MGETPPNTSRVSGESFTQALREVGDWFTNLPTTLGATLAPRRASGNGGGVAARSGSQLGTMSFIDDDTPQGMPKIPSTSILSSKQQVVVGMLLKYVSLGAGWRHRLFVLQDGVLRYYKVFGPTAVNVHQLLETLRQQSGCELFLIGAEVSMLESRDKRALQTTAGNMNSSGNLTRWSTTYRRMPQPHVELHMQVCTMRESHADNRKFYIKTGTKEVMSLRAETKEDRWVWVEALRASKGAWEGVTPVEAGALRRSGSERVVSQDEEFLDMLSQARGRLQQRGVDEETCKWVEQLLVQEHQRLHDVMLAEESKRRALLRIIYTLENDKRQLETALVVEGGNNSAFRRLHAASSETPFASLTAGDAGGSGAVQPRGLHSGGSLMVQSLEVEGSADGNDSGDDVVGRGADRQESLGFAEEDEATDDEFYECETASLSSGRHSRNISTDMSALSASDTGGAQPSQQQQEQQASSLSAGTVVAAAAAKLASQTATAQPPAWLAVEGPAPVRRTRLPKPAQQERSVSLWSLIKEMVGKDLTRVCLPVYFNEPLSALQKTAEDLEYSELLDAAAACAPASVDRLLRIAAFAVSAYSSTPGRTAKPFNPLLGETFEFVCQEKGFRFISEKVSHHPTIIAAQCQGRSWVYEGDAEVKSKFWGRSIEMHPEGLLRVTFSDGEVYTWNKVITSINNLILGKIYIDHGGIMKVRNQQTGLTARIRFKETGMVFDRDPRQVRGYFEQGSRRLDRPLLHGHWDEALYADMPDGTTIKLWEKAPPPPDPTRYNLTAFAIQLNEVTLGLENKLAPTDCRLRPDQHALELGQYDLANAEKQRLEHKQRAARKAAERGEPIRPRWFEVLDESVADGAADQPSQKQQNTQQHKPPARARSGHLGVENLRFKYRGGYWEERAAGHHTGCRDIFGKDVVGAVLE